jgi:chromosome segregation ATPase
MDNDLIWTITSWTGYACIVIISIAVLLSLVFLVFAGMMKILRSFEQIYSEYVSMRHKRAGEQTRLETEITKMRKQRDEAIIEQKAIERRSREISHEIGLLDIKMSKERSQAEKDAHAAKSGVLSQLTEEIRQMREAARTQVDEVRGNYERQLKSRDEVINSLRQENRDLTERITELSKNVGKRSHAVGDAPESRASLRSIEEFKGLDSQIKSMQVEYARQGLMVNQIHGTLIQLIKAGAFNVEVDISGLSQNDTVPSRKGP